MTKICTKCKKRKKLKEFYKDKKTKDGYAYWCKKCCKEYSQNNKEKLAKHRKTYYEKNKEIVKKRALEWSRENKDLVYARKKAKWEDQPLERKEYQRRMMLKYKYELTIDDYEKLLKKQNNVCAICGCKDKNRKNLSIDHCHKTNKIRGLLCCKCNSVLGLCRDNIKLLKSAIKYLKNSRRKK